MGFMSTSVRFVPYAKEQLLEPKLFVSDHPISNEDQTVRLSRVLGERTPTYVTPRHLKNSNQRLRDFKLEA